jgi:hypothetical protein
MMVMMMVMLMPLPEALLMKTKVSLTIAPLMRFVACSAVVVMRQESPRSHNVMGDAQRQPAAGRHRCAGIIEGHARNV